MYIVIIVVIIIFFLFYRSSKIKGKTGEAIVRKILEKVTGYKKIINNIMINDNGKSRQIDHILICSKGVFVIETKNYAGQIYGKEDSDEWKQYLNGKVYNFKNPIFQNYGHKKIIEKTLKDEKNIIPLVVFTTRCKLKVNAKKSLVINTNQLLNYIEMQSFKLNCNQICEYYDKITENRIMDIDTIRNHNDNVKHYIEYKKELLQSDICPKCNGKLIKKQGKYGEFVGCSNYPKCKYTRKV